MADEPTLEDVVAEQRATDPRLSTTEPEPAPEPEPEPTPEPAVEPVAAAEEVPEGQVEPEPEPEGGKKPKKTPVEVLTGRVGHLTKTLSAKDEALNAANARLAAAEALLAAQGRTPPAEGADPAPAPPAPAPGAVRVGERVLTEAEYQADLNARVAAKQFNERADALYDAGKAKFPDWKEAVDTLGAVGVMSPTLLEAVMSTDDGAAVVHHLSGDLDEAQRIAGLPPVQMGAELAKLGVKLAAPKAAPISRAPAPIGSVAGAVTPAVDLERAASTDSNDMSDYIAARAKQGSRWAQPRGERHAR